jgi:1-deoxy-D-xylulose-5-phosphate synthase
MVESVMAARAVESRFADVSVTVADARFMKPLDEEMISMLAKESDILVTVEEGSKGGFGDAVMHFLTNEGMLDNGKLRTRTMVIPDIWIEQGPIPDQYDIAGLNEPHIAAKIESLLQGLREHQVQRRDVIEIKAEIPPVSQESRQNVPLTPLNQ